MLQAAPPFTAAWLTVQSVIPMMIGQAVGIEEGYKRLWELYKRLTTGGWQGQGHTKILVRLVCHCRLKANDEETCLVNIGRVIVRHDF